MTFKNLQQSIKIGELNLKNRVCMAALTRNRNTNGIPGDVNAEYYSQRASAGLILTECTAVEPHGAEWVEAPGIYSKAQIEGWKKVTKAVHDKGGLIFNQLWHPGRVAHPYHNSGRPVVAPSAIGAKGGKFRLLAGEPGYISNPTPIENPKDYVEMFKQAAKNAKEAGFDGIQLHAANGYLINQFIESQTNQRTDKYGGSKENRARFLLEIVDEVSKVFKKSKIAVKLSPSGGYNDMGDGDKDKIIENYSYLISELDKRNIGFIELRRYVAMFDPLKIGTDIDFTIFKSPIKNTKLFLNGNITPEEGEDLIEKNIIDGVFFGRLFIANPDYPKRIFKNLQLNTADVSKFYDYPSGQKHVGYTDYKYV